MLVKFKFDGKPVNRGLPMLDLARVWPEVSPEVAILGADQKERGLWGREWKYSREQQRGILFAHAPQKVF